MEYETPAVYEYKMFVEGVLCSSLDGDNESYGGDPFLGGDADNLIF
jgi:hypothetical protein